MRSPDEEQTPPEEPVAYPIDGILDLHMFTPREVKDLVPGYIAECLRKGIFEIRIIHGKGTGALRRTAESILAKLPEVDSFRQAPEEEGGWGATIVTLRRQEREITPKRD